MIKKSILLVIATVLYTLTSHSQIWTQIGNDIDGEEAGSYSGVSVDISSDGSTIAIGAFKNDGNGYESGHVRIFRNSVGEWLQIGQDIDGEEEGDWSGMATSLSSDGSIVAIGSRKNSGNGYEAGHVRIYENINGTWTQIGEDIDGESPGDQSGISLSLNSDGSIVAIGANHNNGTGVANVIPFSGFF